MLLVRPTGFEPAAFRVGVIRPASWKALQDNGFVGIAQIWGHFEEEPQKPCRAGLLRFFAVVVK